MNQKYKIVNIKDHTNLFWRRSNNYAFSASDTLVSITAAELPLVVKSMPIAFIAHADGFIAVAVLGLHSGGNLSVDSDGIWQGGYVPAEYRSHPFTLTASSDAKQVLCIDEVNGCVVHGSLSEPFFVDGKLSTKLQEELNILQHNAMSRLALSRSCAVLQKYKLICPWPVALTIGRDEQHVRGLFQIDEPALNRLSDFAVAELKESGALALANSQLFAQQHLPDLIKLATNCVESSLRKMKEQKITALANPHLAVQVSKRVVPSNAPRVLLVTFDWSTLVEMSYLVKQADCQVDVLCPSTNVAIKNSFYDYWIDAGSSMESLLSVLIDVVKRRLYKQIVIGDDPILWRIYRDKIRELLHLLPLDNSEALPILNKVGFAGHCKKNGIKSPQFYCIKNESDGVAALQTVGLPIVIKENYSNGGNGVSIFSEAKTFYDFINAYNFDEPLLAQQFIEGHQIGVEALFKHGELLQYICSQELEPGMGPSTKRRYLPNNDEISGIVRQLGRCTLLHGFVNISLMQALSNQRYYLFEADPRPNKWVSYGKWFGCDFSIGFKVFMNDNDNGALIENRQDQLSECPEVEYFPNHVAKLLNERRISEAISHLLDFEKHSRYTLYDPVLLQEKMAAIRQDLKFSIQ